jgi:hypothetical protein
MRLQACALLLAASAQIHAADSLGLAGTDYSSLGTYSYLGTLTPLGHSALGNGWVMRQWVDRLTYRYNGYMPDVHALAWGYAPAIGYQWAMGATHAALSGGVRIAHTNLEPDDPSNVDRGMRVRGTIQGELTNAVGLHIQNQFLAAGEFGNGAYFVRDRLPWQLGHYTLGPEVIFQGSHVYRARVAALCLGGIQVTSRVSLLLRAGVKEQPGQPTVGDFGIELASPL